MHKVTVVGAGFAALTAVRTLRKHDRNLQIDLVAPRPEFVYLPGTIWIPTGKRVAQQLVVPLERFFQRMGVRYHQASATGLDTTGRRLATDQGELENDGIIIASGGRFLKKLPGIEHSITPCEGIAAAERIRERLQQLQSGVIALGFAGNPNEPSAMRGGPMFEYVFGIDRWLRRQGRRDRVKLVFFTPAAQPGQRLGPRAMSAILKQLAERGVELQLGHKLRGFTADRVTTEAGEFAADLIVFMPGMTGDAWFDSTTLPRSPGGLLQANALCQVEGQRRVYVAGDSGSFPGPDWLPKQAHMADLQAEAAAVNLLAELNGQTPKRGFKAELLCIVDSYDTGMLVARTEARNLVLPSNPMFHWTKRAFERWYLRRYR